MATLSSFSLIKKLSLIFNRKAYLVYTNNPIPSLLIPLPTADKTIKSAIYKTFSDLTNDDILTFHNKKLAQKDLNNIQREHIAKLNVQNVNLPHQWVFQNVQGVQVKPQSLFLAVNKQDKSLAFMQYQQIQRQVMTAASKPGQAVYEGQKPKKQKSQKQLQKQDKKIKGPSKQQNSTGQPPKGPRQEQFVKQKEFEHSEISTWNQQSPQLGTKPEDQPKQDQQNVHINKFIPLAYLSDQIASKPIEIIHIQTSKQYLFLQLLKVFCIANILCLYSLINDGTRSQNHWKIRGQQKK